MKKEQKEADSITTNEVVAIIDAGGKANVATIAWNKLKITYKGHELSQLPDSAPFPTPATESMPPINQQNDQLVKDLATTAMILSDPISWEESVLSEPEHEAGVKHEEA